MVFRFLVVIVVSDEFMGMRVFNKFSDGLILIRILEVWSVCCLDFLCVSSRCLRVVLFKIWCFFVVLMFFR